MVRPPFRQALQAKSGLEDFIFEMQFSLFQAADDQAVIPGGTQKRSNRLIQIVMRCDQIVEPGGIMGLNLKTHQPKIIGLLPGRWVRLTGFFGGKNVLFR